MLGPVLALAGIAGYYLYKHSHTASGRPLGVTESTIKDPVTGLTFHAQFIESFKDDTAKYDIFLMPAGTRVLTYLQTGSNKQSRQEIIHPSGVDPSIRAAALRVYGVRPKAG